MSSDLSRTDPPATSTGCGGAPPLGLVPGPLIELLPGRVGDRLQFESIFQRVAPVEIEVGIGKGRFLLQQAEERPDFNYLGLEWSRKHLRVAKERAVRRGLTNVRLYRADARHVLADLVPDGSLQRLHVYCPDPWPKKRHRKRRFFTERMVPHLERVLTLGGYLNLSTDVEPYFEEIDEILSAHTSLKKDPDPLFLVTREGGSTNYEVKYMQAGRFIHRASYRRFSPSRE